MAVTIIAEAGVNPDGNPDKALRLCDAAREASAQIVKFQTFDAQRVFRPGPALHKAMKLMMSQGSFKIIARYCEGIGIEFCSTPDDLDSLKFLVEECGIKRIKIGSGSLLYEPLVDAAFDTGLPILLSTGMATFREVEQVLKRQYGRQPGSMVTDVTVMHCVSLYPCPPELANVRAMERLRDGLAEYDYLHVGYSDHTIGDHAALAAVTLGATVIEKHFTLDHRDDGPDHQMSFNPGRFLFFVQALREIEKVLGDGRKEPSEAERAMILRFRKDAEGYQPGL